MKSRLRKKLAKKQRASVTPISPVAGDWVISLAIECWRAARLIPDLNGHRHQLLLRSAIDNITALVEAQGIEIEDPIHTDVSAGTTLTVALTEPVITLPRGARRVIETLSPNIYISGKLARPARVVLGVGSGE